MTQKIEKKMVLLFALILFGISQQNVYCQQQDVPEPVFLNFSIQPSYYPSYQGRDPFKALDNIYRSPQISIIELDFHGIIQMDKESIGLFSWRGNPSVRYTLKSRKLFSGLEKVIDGVVGDISENKVVLIQGSQKIEFLRKQK